MTVIIKNTEDANVRQGTAKKKHKVCSVETVKKRIPIVKWAPKYSFSTLVQDIIAGITVGLTAIPQGIAYAIVAGLSPEYGLYSCLLGGIVYLIFGSCKDVTVGPTAILSAIVAKYVASYSADFAVAAAFLSGIIVLVMGLLQLGFLVEFISTPVISGFTTAAALQIISSQLRSLFGLAGPSGNYFSESIYYFTKNIATVKLWDTVLGFITIGILVFLQKLGRGCCRTDGLVKWLRWFVSLGRNAVVVIIGILVAFVIKHVTGDEPLTLIGSIGRGIPKFSLPPFGTVVGNQTYEYTDMLTALGPQAMVIPLVSILESVAIAKAFAGGKIVDATQEMIALGLCNIFGSFVRAMPVTGSFTRTALNHSSGVQTTCGGVFTSLLIILALTLMTDAFYYIPKASLAALIITALSQMIDFPIFCRLWRNSKKELVVLVITIAVSLSIGLEYGIVFGIISDACILVYLSARPRIRQAYVKTESREAVLISLKDSLFYCAGEHLRRHILNSTEDPNSLIILDGSNLSKMDSTVALNLMGAVRDLNKNANNAVFFNFKDNLKKMCIDIYPEAAEYFVTAAKVEDCFKLERLKVLVD